MCCVSTFHKQWTDFHTLSLLFHHAVDLVFHMFLSLSFKEQWMLFSMCCHSPFDKQWIHFHILQLLFHLAVNAIFHMLPLPSLKNYSHKITASLKINTFLKITALSLLSLKEQWMQFSMCSHGMFNKQWVEFNMLSLLFHHAVHLILHMWSLLSFKEQWVLLSMCCFPCVVTAHLISSGWNSICSHHCLTTQWM